MKRFLGHPLSAVSIILLGLLIHLNEQSIARAGFSTGSDRADEAIVSEALALDRMLSKLVAADTAECNVVPFYAESIEVQQIAHRISELRTAIAAMPTLDVYSSEIGERVELQRQIVHDYSEALAKRNDMFSQLPAVIPAVGRYSSEFGYRVHPVKGVYKMHTGIDIAAKTGTPIVASAGGVIVFSGRKNGYGNTIEIDHGFGYKTLYAHASKLVANVGDTVAAGDLVALVGSTGMSTGPHCHFEIIVDSVRVNPVGFLPPLDLVDEHNHDDSTHVDGHESIPGAVASKQE